MNPGTAPRIPAAVSRRRFGRLACASAAVGAFAATAPSRAATTRSPKPMKTVIRPAKAAAPAHPHPKIGRASCRERV